MRLVFHFRKFPETQVVVDLPFLPTIGDHINAGKCSGKVASIAYSLPSDDSPVTEMHVEMEEN